jgi:hypothetical protein
MRFQLSLPDIDYGPDEGIQYPVVSNNYDGISLPDKFCRWGTQVDKPFHCFVDDWRLESIWRHKYKMVDRVILSRVAVLPDYTVEENAPLLHAVYQVWRSRVVGRYWQDHGVQCIPSLQWSRPEINQYLFAGLEYCDVVAVRSPTRGTVDAWAHCARQYLEMCKPKLVLHFGTKCGLDIWPCAVNLNLR